MLSFKVLLGLDHVICSGSFIPWLCMVQSAYLRQEYQSLKLKSTSDPHTLNFCSFSNLIGNTERMRILISLTPFLEKLLR